MAVSRSDVFFYDRLIHISPPDAAIGQQFLCATRFLPEALAQCKRTYVRHLEKDAVRMLDEDHPSNSKLSD